MRYGTNLVVEVLVLSDKLTVLGLEVVELEGKLIAITLTQTNRRDQGGRRTMRKEGRGWSTSASEHC